MAEEANLGASPFAKNKDTTKGTFSQIRAKFKVDSDAIRKMTGEFEQLNKKLKDVNKTLDEMITKSAKASGNMGGITGGASGGSSSGTTSSYAAQNSAIASTRAPTPPTPTTPTGLKGLIGKAGGGSGIASAGFGILGDVLSSSRSRINSMYEYSISADRLGVLFQQTQGISQNQYANQMRRPLTANRLGEGGINALLGMQANTGISAAGQAQSVDALRTATGFAYTGQQVSQMISGLGSPQVNNRMSIMTGMGLYGVGGKQNSAMDVMQNIVRVSGLNNESVMKGAMQQGSMTRARLTSMGLPEDMQNMVLQYSQSNLEYQKRTGKKDMYNPADKEQQKTMGINDNFATQFEETVRTEGNRDENFYRRQADNYAQLEKNTQTLTEMFGKLEDKLSGLIGKQVEMPTKHTGWLRRLAPLAGAALGAGLGSVVPVIGTTAGAIIGGAAGAAVAQGDPVPGDVTLPTYGQAIPMSSLAGRPDWAKLHPTMQQRLSKMFKENPNVGIGSGWRSTENQKQLFLSRYTRTEENTGTYWDGSYWNHTSGAPAAPPGRSMHEIGLAMDLVGDLDWVQQNAARFGLKTFANVAGVNEPWHVQPDDLPNTRGEYEAQGSPWGSDGAFNAADDAKSQSGAQASGQIYSPISSEHGVGGANSMLRSYSGMSLSAAMEAFKANNSLMLAGSPTSGSVNSLRAKRGAGSSKTAGTGGSGGSTITSSDTGGVLIARLLAAQGYRGDDLRIMLAIAQGESRLNSRAHNGVGEDDSYGLFQINMKGDYGPKFRSRYGLSSNEDLYDPATNVRVASEMQRDRGFTPWSVYTSGEYKQNMATAASYASAAGVGDPVMPTRGGGGGPTVVNGGHSVTIAPVIHVNGGSSWQADLPIIAKEVGRLLEQETRRVFMRSE